MALNPSTDVAALDPDTLRLCESKVESADLDHHYSLLFAPAMRRASLTALYAWWYELREIPIECSDPSVANVKLAWWHEEMHAVYNGQPRHPVAVALRPAVADHQLPAALFFEVIEALARHASVQSYPTEDALVEHGAQSRGSIEQLAARMLRGSDVPDARALGARLELARLLCDTGAGAQRGLNYLPHDETLRFGVDSRDIAQGRPTDSLKRLIAVRAQRLQEELLWLATDFPRDILPDLAPMLVATALSHALLDRVRHDPAVVLREHPRLPALRRFWIAWRSAYRAKHGRR